jgi:hypothetical protein
MRRLIVTMARARVVHDAEDASQDGSTAPVAVRTRLLVFVRERANTHMPRARIQVKYCLSYRRHAMRRLLREALSNDQDAPPTNVPG